MRARLIAHEYNGEAVRSRLPGRRILAWLRLLLRIILQAFPAAAKPVARIWCAAIVSRRSQRRLFKVPSPRRSRQGAEGGFSVFAEASRLQEALERNVSHDVV